MENLAIPTLVAAFIADLVIAKTDTPHTLYERMVREYARAGRIDLVKQLRARKGDVQAELWKQAPRRGTLWQTYSPRAAPGPGERGYRAAFRTEGLAEGAYDGWAHSLDELASGLMARTIELMEEPEVAWLYADATDPRKSADENTAAWLELADLVGLPRSGHSRQLTDQERAGSMEFLLELSMETDDMRWGGLPPGSSTAALLSLPAPPEPGQQPAQQRYDLRGEQPRTGKQGQPDPSAPRPGPTGYGPVPVWLAEAILMDSMAKPVQPRLHLVPVSRDEAAAFIAQHHSKLPEYPYRTMYALGAALGDRLVAVATAGHPSGPWTKLKGPADRLKRIRKVLNYTFAKHAEQGLDVAAMRRFSRSLTPLLKAEGIDAVEDDVDEFVSQLPRKVAAEIRARLDSYEGRGVDQRNVLELTRVASDGTVRNAASMLAARILDLLPTSGRADPRQSPMLVTYQLSSEDGSTYKALADRGMRPVFFAPARHRPSGGDVTGQRKQVKSLKDVDKVVWQAGPLATVADWSLLKLRPGERPAYSGSELGW